MYNTIIDEAGERDLCSPGGLSTKRAERINNTVIATSSLLSGK